MKIFAIACSLAVASAAFDNEDRLMAGGSLTYSATAATAGCKTACAGEATTAATSACDEGCDLWLHTSSLNYESAEWQTKLMDKCKKDCTMPRLWKASQTGFTT